MIYEIIVKSQFSAAHYLESVRGKRENIHGHNWFVEARITRQELDNEGMIIDFALATECLKEVLKELDHKDLNEIPCFTEINPTTEHVARFIYEKLEKNLISHDAKLNSITLWETPNCAVTYKEHP